MRKQVMRRAWELKRAGWAAEFGECLRAAWAEAKSGVMIDLSPEPPQVTAPPQGPTVIVVLVDPVERMTWREWWLGWLATAG